MATGPAARLYGAPLSMVGVEEDAQETADLPSSQPSSTEGGEKPSVSPVDKIKRLVTGAALALYARPLLFGAVFVLFISIAAGRSSWGFTALPQNTGLGGADVEEVIVEDPGSALSSLDASIVTGASAFAASPSENPATVDDEQADQLVTIPWSPVMPTGASGRNVQLYTVKDGDTLSSIAAVFNISTQSAAWSNNLVDPDSIRPGDTLRIPPVDGVLHIVKPNETVADLAKKYSAQADQIIAYNGLPATGALNAGDEIIVPGGTMPPPPPPPAAKPAPKRTPTTSAPRFASAPNIFGYFIAPTTGHDYGRIHSNNGVDIANKCGTPVYAAAAGRVTRADGSGWNGGYGKVVEIAHDNGTDTRYAHLSQFVVDGGEVAQGQLIGLIGTTGRSTGCHLHFEVHGARNPLAF